LWLQPLRLLVSRPAVCFDLPPERAIAFFRDKGLAASFAWQDRWQEEHDAAFKQGSSR
jgi:hypothetical protein